MKGVILCVDDEPIVLHSLKAQLRRRFAPGFRFEVAESVAEAREILADYEDRVEEPSDLVVISDWLMPEVRGDVFLEEVSRRFPAAVLILLTGQADSRAIASARERAGLEECLLKPWREDDLGSVIEGGLERRHR